MAPKEKIAINREAHDKSKGFRLQRLRAVELMIDSAEYPDDTHFFWATEFKEDVYENREGEQLLEEDKAYSSESTFTFNSVEVKKALVSFVDLWINYQLSSKIQFNFHASNKIGKESSSGLTKKVGKELPENSLIELAIEEPLSDDFLDIAPEMVIHMMEEVYSKDYFNLVTIKKWDKETWRRFFGQISWEFQQPNEEELEEVVLEKIRNCRWFSASDHHGMETFIKAKLSDDLERKQSKPDYLNRVVSKAEVQLTFEQLKSDPRKKKDDCIWKMWETIEQPNDKRNITEKLQAVWSEIPQQELKRLMRRATQGGVERDSHSSDNDFMSIRYWVYDACLDELTRLIDDGEIKKINPDQCIDKLKVCADEKIKDLKKSYTYEFNSSTLVYNVILELVDNCYLAFDKNES